MSATLVLVCVLVGASMLQSTHSYTCYQTGSTVALTGQGIGDSQSASSVSGSVSGMRESGRGLGCGLCPRTACLDLPAISLGYCCGYKQPRDVVPISCDKVVCPPPSALLWKDYNYLMDCCC